MRISPAIPIALLLVGLAYRLWPTVTGVPALTTFFMTEDGYLMLTVARNMATGLGMSVSDGTIPTNGIQPMIAFFFTIPYLLSGGDKVTSLIGIHLILAVVALLAALAIRPFARRVLGPRDPGPAWPWAVALLWFLGPLLVRHSMNGLETGLATLSALLAILAFGRVLEADPAGDLGRRLLFGAMAGLAVLARIDQVFLVSAIFLVWAGWELFVIRHGLVAMVTRLVPPGLLSIAVASPWLISNQMRFGSVMPVSGPAQSLGARFGQNAELLPSKLFESAFPMIPIPSAMERDPAVMAIAGAATALVLAIFFWRMLRHATPVARALVLAYTLFGVALAVYYGLFFGAGHFLSRYLAPLAPLLILAALIAALEVGRWVVRSRPEILGLAYVLGGLLLSLALLGRAVLPGKTIQGHEQVIAWVDENVPNETWIGAVQTGTLGYWHDRTYNLDGKVNPEALEARRTKGHVLDYITDSDMDYVVDWQGVGSWVEFDEAQGGFADAFELVLRDQQANLAVLRRKGIGE